MPEYPFEVKYTPEEADAAIGQSVSYRPTGS